MMRLAPLDRDRMRDLIEDIESCRQELDRLVRCSKQDFEKDSDLYATTEHYFRRALEGILTAGTHILSRLPVKTKDYTEVITELGKKGIVSEDFAQRNKGLAGYRNRLSTCIGKFLPANCTTQFMNILRTYHYLRNRTRTCFDIRKSGT